MREFGFSEYAARVYLALLDLGTSPARDVSTLSKVPTSKIYHVLEQLHEKGLVRILPESPKRYAPVPFDQYVERLVRDHRSAAESLEDEREELAEEFSVQGDTDLAQQGFFTTVRGRKNVISRIRDMVAGATEDVLVMGTAGVAERYTHFREEMERIQEAGVSLRMMVPVTDETVEAFTDLAEVVEVRHRQVDDGADGSVAILLVDGREAFVITFIPDDGHLYQGKDVALHTDQASMVATIRALVAPRWAVATPFEARREQLESGRAPEFTRYYTKQADVQGAVVDALDGGVRDLCYVNPLPARRLAGPGSALYERLQAAGGPHRILLNFQDVDVVDAYQELAERSGAMEFRHIEPTVLSRFILFGDAEAMFSTVRPEAMSLWDASADPSETQDLFIHTSNASTVESLRAQFDALWAQASPLGDRRRELEAFPRLNPRDLGISRLFDSVHDAVVVADPCGEIVLWNAGAEEVFGYSAEEAIGQPVELIIPERMRGHHRRGVANFHATGKGDYVDRQETLELPAVRKDGTEISVEMSLGAIPQADGSGAYALAIVRDVTERVRAEASAARERANVRLLSSVASAANRADSVDGVVRETLRLVCEHTGWPVGHAYVRAAGDEAWLEPTGVWHINDDGDAEAFRALQEATGAARFNPGEGLPGRVAQEGAPEWITDVAEHPDFPRAQGGRDLGVRGAFAFPVKVGDEVAAVLEFFTRDAAAPDTELLGVMDRVGTQLGRVFERTRAREALRRHDRLLAQAQRMAGIGYWVFDAVEDRLEWGEETCRIFGVEPGAFDPSFAAYLERVHPADRDRIRGLVDRALEAGESYEDVKRIVRPDGEVRVLRSRGEAEVGDDGEVRRLVGVCQDVTDVVGDGDWPGAGVALDAGGTGGGDGDAVAAGLSAAAPDDTLQEL